MHYLEFGSFAVKMPTCRIFRLKYFDRKIILGMPSFGKKLSLLEWSPRWWNRSFFVEHLFGMSNSPDCWGDWVK